MKKVFFIFFLFVFLLQHTLAQNPFITNYSVSDGLPTSKVFCAFQDSQGFMWFGTDAGVTRFDGNKFIHFSENDGLSGNVVIRIKEDFIGQIWFLNINGTVNYFHNNKIYNSHNAPFLGELKTNFYYHNFFQDTDSTLYFYNQASEIEVVKNHQYIDYADYSSKNPKRSNSISLLNSGSNGNLQLWTNTGITELENIDTPLNTLKQATIVHKAFSIGDNKTLVVDPFGSVHLYHDTKIIRNNICKAESQNINDIIIDKENFIWVSTYDKGIFCYKDSKLVLHLPIKKAQTLILDNENNIWTASNINGIYKINRDILKYKFIGNDQFDNAAITDLAYANNGDIWATNGNSLYMIANKSKFPSKLKAKGGLLEHIYQLKNNTVILSGTSSYINLIENVRPNFEKQILEKGKSKPLKYQVKKVAVDSSESTLFSYLNDILIIAELKDSKDTWFFEFKRGRIHNIFFNYKNQLVVNASKNYIISGDIISNTSIYDRFNGQIITSNLVIDSRSEILNIYGNNLYLIKDEQIFNLSEKMKTQIDYRIKDMAYCGNTLFLFTIKSVYYITKPLDILLNKPLKVNCLNIEFNNINDILCKDSLLYVASDDGLTLIPVTECNNTSLQATKPYLTKILLDDKNYDISSNLIEFKQKRRLSIEFSSLNYSSVPSEYAYKMEGLDEIWSTGSETKIVYSNLAPGKYTFQIKARKNKEPYSKIVALPVTVQPTLFQRTSTKIIILLVLVLLLYVAIHSFFRKKIERKETDHLLITLEHKALQSMMNPHFIFNALGSIQCFLLQNKSSEAGSYLSQFARLIRQNMNSLKSNYICIEIEVDRLRNYMNLEQLRMNDRFKFEIQVDNKLDSYDTCIPSMIIQPFVENAIWHGISALKDGGIIIIVFNYLNEKSIEVLIEDNGVGIQENQSQSTKEHGLNMGMTITKKRLQLIGQRHHVKAELVSKHIRPGDEFPGTQIKIIIPIINDES